MINVIKVELENAGKWKRAVRNAVAVFVQVSGLHDCYPLKVSKSHAIRFLGESMGCGFEVRISSNNEVFIDRISEFDF